MTPEDRQLATLAAEIVRGLRPPLQGIVARAADVHGLTTSQFAAWIIESAIEVGYVEELNELSCDLARQIVVVNALFDTYRDQ